MKIAVCVSGQLRGRYEECIPTWEKMFDPRVDQIDYFVHTWTNSTAPNKVAYANKDDEEKNEILYTSEISAARASDKSCTRQCVSV